MALTVIGFFFVTCKPGQGLNSERVTKSNFGHNKYVHVNGLTAKTAHPPPPHLAQWETAPPAASYLE